MTADESEALPGHDIRGRDSCGASAPAPALCAQLARKSRASAEDDPGSAVKNASHKTEQGANTDEDRHKYGRDDGTHYQRLVTTVTLHGDRFPKVGRRRRYGFRSAPPPWTLGKVLSGRTPKGSYQEEDRSM